MINKRLESFFYLLDCAIHNKNIVDRLREDPDKLQLLKETDWEEIAKIAYSTKTFSLLYSTIFQGADILEIDEAVVMGWKQKALGLMIWELEKHKSVYALVEEAKKRKIKIVVFKGIIIAELYPQYTQRISGDMDIWVSDEEEGRAIEMIEALGYLKNDNASKDGVQVYLRQSPFHLVELHTRLWENYKGKTIDIVKAMRLTAEQSLIEVSACGIDVLTLGINEHLIYQIFHIVKHFMLERVGIKYLIDLVLYIERYSKEIDFNLFWEKMNSLGYATFCKNLFAICTSYLGMDKTILGGEGIEPGLETQTLLEDILNINAQYNKTARWQLMGAMTPYFLGEKNVKSSKTGRILDVIFLRPKDLTNDYGYAKKHPLLLPIAWIHRAYKYFKNWFANKKNYYDVNEKLDVAEQRLFLMSGLGLVNEKRKSNSK